MAWIASKTVTATDCLKNEKHFHFFVIKIPNYFSAMQQQSFSHILFRYFCRRFKVNLLQL
jgi:hypothetical protein